NGPLPAWPGWYVQQRLPHAFHAATALITLVVELVIVWALFLPRPFRRACCAIVTVLQIAIIATANYAFLNYLVLMLGVLLLDDDAVEWIRRRLRVPSDPLRASEVSVDTPRQRALRWTEAGVLAWVFYSTIAVFPGGTLRFLPFFPARILGPF